MRPNYDRDWNILQDEHKCPAMGECYIYNTTSEYAHKNIYGHTNTRIKVARSTLNFGWSKAGHRPPSFFAFSFYLMAENVSKTDFSSRSLRARTVLSSFGRRKRGRLLVSRLKECSCRTDERMARIFHLPLPVLHTNSNTHTYPYVFHIYVKKYA